MHRERAGKIHEDLIEHTPLSVGWLKGELLKKRTHQTLNDTGLTVGFSTLDCVANATRICFECSLSQNESELKSKELIKGEPPSRRDCLFKSFGSVNTSHRSRSIDDVNALALVLIKRIRELSGAR